MTDLSKGIIEINGFDISPDTKQDEFERVLGDRFQKCINKYNSDISTFYFNGYAGIFSDFDDSRHTTFTLNGMTFNNIVIDFENNKIRGIQLVSNLQSYEINANKEKVYSSQKEEECYLTLEKWAIHSFGESTNNTHCSACWNYGWGCFRPTPYSALGSDTRVFLVEYGRNYEI